MIGNLFILCAIFAGALGTGVILIGLYDQLVPEPVKLKVDKWFNSLI